MTLTDFLLARIAEDEADIARIGYDRHVADFPGFQFSVDHPLRLLAECEAKRRIVEIASTGVSAVSEGRPHRSFLSGRVHDSARILLALALPYADHPDYRDEWRP